MKKFLSKLFNLSNNDLQESSREIEEEIETKNGLVETYVDYQEGGEIVKMKCSVNYKDGEMDGLYTMTDPDGGIRLKINYVMGVKEGLVENFHKNGNLLSRTEFKDDLENGVDEMYDQGGNGVLVVRSSYVNGLEDGLCEYLDEEGKVLTTTTFKNGEEID